MGKTKHKRHSGSKNQPTGLPSVREFEARLELEGPSTKMDSVYPVPVNNTVLTLVDKLQSGSSEEKECSLSTITALVAQPDNIVQFLTADLVKIAGPLLIDPALTIRKAALGALRNVSVDGGPDACEKMVTDDIMTPLVALLLKYGSTVPSQMEESASSGDTLQDEVFHQALHLLWNLCENSAVAVKVVNQQGLLPLLLRQLSSDTSRLAIAITAAHCLYTVTEDNSAAVTQLAMETTLVMLKGLLATTHTTSQQLLLRVLSAGIVYNLWGVQLGQGTGLAVQEVIDVMVTVLQADAIAGLQRVCDFLLKLMTDGVAGDGASDSVTMAEADADKQTTNGAQCAECPPGAVDDCQMDDDKTPSTPTEEGTHIKHRELDAMTMDVHHLLLAQQLAVELVANLCCSGDDDDCWEEADSSDTNSDDMAVTVATPADDNQESMQPALCLPGEIQKAFTSSGLIPKVMSKVQSASDDVITQLQSHEDTSRIAKALAALQMRALLCVNNVVGLLDVEDLGGIDALHDLWPALSHMTTTQSVLQNVELLEATTSALRAVIQKLGELNSPKLMAVEASDLTYLHQLGSQCDHAHIRVNTIRIVSSVGCVLAREDPPPPLLGTIGSFLLDVTSGDKALWVTAEALDALFDVFAEDSTDPVAKDIALVDRLQAMVPALKTKVHQQKRHLGEHLPVIMMARSNLGRFIKYKASRFNAA